MHWVAWAFWISIIALGSGSFLVDRFSRNKYDYVEIEKSLNQNTAIADSYRDVARRENERMP